MDHIQEQFRSTQKLLFNRASQNMATATHHTSEVFGSSRTLPHRSSILILPAGNSLLITLPGNNLLVLLPGNSILVLPHGNSLLVLFTGNSLFALATGSIQLSALGLIHESFEFQSPWTAASTLHKCPPLVVTSEVSSRALPSSIINGDADELLPADVVIGKYPKLCKSSKIPTLVVKLALESFFGHSVLVRCTPKGCRDLPGLPTAEPIWNELWPHAAVLGYTQWIQSGLDEMRGMHWASLQEAPTAPPPQSVHLNFRFCNCMCNTPSFKVLY